MPSESVWNNGQLIVYRKIVPYENQFEKINGLKEKRRRDERQPHGARSHAMANRWADIEVKA